jgi:hypothetical protein
MDLLRAQLVAAEAGAGVLGAQLAQTFVATPRLIKLEEEIFFARASPAPTPGQAP